MVATKPRPQGSLSQDFALLFLALTYICVEYWGLSLYQRSPHLSTSIVLVILTGMIYDIGVLGIGRWLKPSKLLRRLNYLRFLFHNLCLPFLIVVGLEILDKTNFHQIHTVAADIFCLWIVLVSILIGLRSCLSLELIPEKLGNTFHYISKVRTIPHATIFTCGILVAIGCYLWIQKQWPWLLIGTIISITGNSTTSLFYQWRRHLCAAVELVFMVAILVTDVQFL